MNWDGCITLGMVLKSRAEPAHQDGLFCHFSLLEIETAMTQPSFERRILLCATGMSPQIVTETLYALAVKPSVGQTPWLPTEVHLITTRRGAEHARLNLLSGKPGWFHQLQQDYGLPQMLFSPEQIHCIQGVDGQDLDDIRTPADNEAAANAIAELMRAFSQQEQTQLHVSIAGGRKTMGYYLGYALSLYGRPQDRLSHVLVSDPYEAHPEFYYPTPYERVIHTRDPKQPQAKDCRDAVVELAEIPFVRLRDGLPQRLLDGHTSFTETVEVANLAQGTPVLNIDLSRKSVEVSGLPVVLGDPGFALYAWLAQRALTEDPEVDWIDPAQWRGEFLPLVAKIFNSMDAARESIESSLDKNFKESDNETANYFQPIYTRINKALNKGLGTPLALRCQIQKSGRKGASRYHLPVGLDIRITP
jgi:CRISPR-associated protein (TIGR02584 family)